MRRLKFIFMANAFIWFGLMTSVATVSQYRHAGACTPLHGIPGILQAANLIPTGDCKLDSRRGQCKDSHACNLSNPSTKGAQPQGNCRTVNGACVCVAHSGD